MSDTIKPANRIPSLLAAICFALAALLFPIHRLIMRISCLNDASFYTLENFLIGIGRSFLSDFTTIHGLIYIAYYTFSFAAVILLAIFAITAARGKAKTPLFVIGVALWVFGWGVGNISAYWYDLKDLFYGNIYFLWDFGKQVLMDSGVCLPLVALGVMALVKTKHSWLSLIPSLWLGGAFMVIIFFSLRYYSSLFIEDWYTEYYSEWFIPLTMICMVLLYGYYLLFTGGIIFGSFAAVKRTKKAKAVDSCADRFRALDEALQNGAISEDEYAAKRAELIEQL